MARDDSFNIILYKCNVDNYHLFIKADQKEVELLKSWNKKGGSFKKCETCNGSLTIDKIYDNKEDYIKDICKISYNYPYPNDIRFRRELKELWQ